jgi:RNA polymerase sigma-70 factor (ECF subfamily)
VSTPEEQDLVERARAGDRDAVAALIAGHLPSLVAYVRLEAGPLVRGRESVADVVQSACREALADLGGFRYQGTAQLRHWLCKHALHKIQNKHRGYRAARRNVEREAGAADDEALAMAHATLCTPSRHAIGREDLAAFERAFAALPREQAEAVLLRRVVGLGYPEIAQRLGKSEGAARNLVYRGVARLAASTRTDDGR